MLDIIIPQYSEDNNMIKPLLDSIKNQIDIDFSLINITIVNDYSNTLLDLDFLDSYNLGIKYYRNERNTGPGLARQYGILNTNDKFIMFIDADDILYSNKSLYYVIDFIKKNNPDYVIGNIAVEDIINGKESIVIRKGRDTFPWMHSKIYKREFLVKNDIIFHPNIRYVEDQYFTTSVLGFIRENDLLFLDKEIVLWKRNTNSLTRKKTKYHYLISIFDDFFNAPLYTYEFLKSHNCYLKYSYIINATFGIYIILNSSVFESQELNDMKEEYEEKFLSYIKLTRNLFIIANKNDLEKMFNEELNQLVIRNDIKNVSCNFTSFLNKYITKKAS